jgi:integrase
MKKENILIVDFVTDPQLLGLSISQPQETLLRSIYGMELNNEQLETAWKNHVDNFIVADLGTLKIGQVDVQGVEKAAAKWQERTSAKTANKVLTTLTAIMAMAKRHKKIKDNPAGEAERLKLATQDEDSDEITPDKVYSKEDVGKLIAATEPGTMERVLVMALAFLGLRIGEALALAWPAIDLKAGKLRVLLTLADSDKGEEPLFQPPKSTHSRRTRTCRKS